MALIYVQTDDGGSYGTQGHSDAFCTGLTAVPTSSGYLCSVGGTPGVATRTNFFSDGGSGTNVLGGSGFFVLQPATGVSWDDGTWTVRFNVTASNMNLTVVGIYICRANSSDVNQATIGSATGLSISLGSTGVKSQDVTGAAQSPAAGDQVTIAFAITNGSMNFQGADVLMGQNIDSPFSQVTPSLLRDPLFAMRPHLVRKVRDFFLGGLPPKLAKLRMVKNDVGLYLPANDPQLRKVA